MIVDEAPNSVSDTANVLGTINSPIPLGSTPSAKPKKSNLVFSHSETEGKQSKRQQTEAHLRVRFRFRYNQLTGGIEYSPIDCEKYIDLDDYRLNSLCRQIDAERGVIISSGNLLEYLRSDFTPAYHPLTAYFEKLPKAIGTATIEAIADTVQVNNPILFREALQKWMVASVANTYQAGCQNHTCLVLTGEQGGYKTTWLNGLCPPSLDRYRFTGKINLESKDTLILLATKFIINLDDQLRELNKKDADTVKTLITHGDVTVRRPYDKITSELTRIGSFVASVNHNEFLSDSTGSRRFLPFEALNIDIPVFETLDIDQAWAEAYTLYRTPGFRYWFTAEEVVIKFDGNREFEVNTPEYELLHEYYEVVTNELDANIVLRTSLLLAKLQEKVPRTLLTVKKLGEALRKSKAIRKTAGRHSGEDSGKKAYLLRERGELEIAEQTRAHLPVTF